MKKFENLTFCDDFMFWKVMTQYEEICRQIVELCIGKKVHEIRYKEDQKTMKILPEAKGVRLDVYLEDEMRTHILINACGDERGCSEEMKSFLSAVRGVRPENGIGEQICEAVTEITSHEKWRAEYMMLGLRMEEIGREKYGEGFEKGQADGLEQGRADGLEQGLKQGFEQGRLEVADRMILAGRGDDEILELTGISPEELRQRRDALAKSV